MGRSFNSNKLMGTRQPLLVNLILSMMWLIHHHAMQPSLERPYVIMVKDNKERVTSVHWLQITWDESFFFLLTARGEGHANKAIRMFTWAPIPFSCACSQISGVVVLVPKRWTCTGVSRSTHGKYDAWCLLRYKLVRYRGR